MVSKKNPEIIRDIIRQKYTRVSESVVDHFNYFTGGAGLDLLGYDSAFILSAPKKMVESFCGAGNPFSFGIIEPGDIVLDVGCGAGFDLYFASCLVGESGRVFGIDLTPAMIKKAKEHLDLADVFNAEISVAYSEDIPFENNKFDVVISNGVLNLSPDKDTSFSEIFRVLKSGGYLCVADIVLKKELPQNETIVTTRSH